MKQTDTIELARLEREIEEMAAEQADCQARAKALLQREAAGASGLARQIHELKQEKMMLATQMQRLKVRLNRLLLGGF